MSIVVRPGEPSDVRAAAAVLGEAFDGSPWTAWTVAASHHRERIESLQALVLEHIAIPWSACWVAERVDDGEIVGASVWTRPDRPPPTDAWHAITDRVAALEGDRHVASLVAADATRHLQPAEPHVYLGAVGTVSVMQRSGIGTAVVRPGLDLAGDLGVAVFLETSTPENVRWYEALGFAVTGRVDLPDGPTVWTMQRDAAASDHR